ncbi:MAG: glutathione S-transferase [Rhodospirillaceae bacterium]|nr:glutathione S-transferase [Rhodospirillaceae bacterium]
MKLYDFKLAPNPKRVRMFLAEKGIEVPLVQVNTREREQFSDWFRKVNPGCTVPVLELDDSTCIAETVAICRYFEALQPEPPLMGRDAKDQGVVEMWNRRAEIEGFMVAGDVVRNALPMFADRGVPGLPSGVPQIPALAERGKAGMRRFFDKIDARLGETRFLAGDAFTIADITAYITIEFVKRAEVEVPEACGNVRRWVEDIAARPSTSA